MTQTIIVGIVVAAALFFAVRRLLRTLKGKGGCHGGCDGCPLKDGGECHCAHNLPDIDPDRL